jgi:hypothetical protein
VGVFDRRHGWLTKDTDDDGERARDRRRESLLIDGVHSTLIDGGASHVQRRRNEKGRADFIGAACAA